MAKKASKTATKVAVKKTPKKSPTKSKRPSAGTSQRKTKKKIETSVYDFAMRGLAEALTLFVKAVNTLNMQAAEMKRLADLADIWITAKKSTSD